MRNPNPLTTNLCIEMNYSCQFKQDITSPANRNHSSFYNSKFCRWISKNPMLISFILLGTAIGTTFFMEITIPSFILIIVPMMTFIGIAYVASLSKKNKPIFIAILVANLLLIVVNIWVTNEIKSLTNDSNVQQVMTNKNNSAAIESDASKSTTKKSESVKNDKDKFVGVYIWEKHGKGYLSEKKDWVAIVIAFFSFIFAVSTWKSQSDTQKNTLGLTSDVQKGILLDFPRHHYRNLLVVCAMKYLMNQEEPHGLLGRKTSRYNLYCPSEEHFLKLVIDEQMLYPEAFDDDKDSCSELHRFRLNIRNRNIEMKSIFRHIARKNLPERLKRKEMNRLIDLIDMNAKLTRDKISDFYCQTTQLTAQESLQRLNDSLNKYHKEVLERIEEALKQQEVIDHCFYSGLKISINKSGALKVKKRDFVKAFFPDEKDIRADIEKCALYPETKQKKDVKSSDSNRIKNEKDLLDYINAEIWFKLHESEDCIHLIPLS